MAGGGGGGVGARAKPSAAGSAAAGRQGSAAAAMARASPPAGVARRPRVSKARRRTLAARLPPLLLAILLLAVLLLGCPTPSLAGIHVSHIMQDGRALIPLSPDFGFDPRGGGGVVVTLRGPLIVYRAQPPPGSEAEAVPPNLDNFGLLLVPVGDQRDLHEQVARGECPLEALGAGADDAAAAARAKGYLPVLSFGDPALQPLVDNRADNYTLHVEMATGGGWYGLWFASCEAHTPVTFSARAELFNPAAGGGGGGGAGGAGASSASGRRNYLSVGHRELDEVYAAFAAAYVAAAVACTALVCRAARCCCFGGRGFGRAGVGGGGGKGGGGLGSGSAAAAAAAAGASPEEVAAAARGGPVVKPLHWLMAALVLVKAATLVCQAVSIRVVEATGRAEGGWERARLAFFVLRGVFLFCVLVLLASGWSLLNAEGGGGGGGGGGAAGWQREGQEATQGGGGGGGQQQQQQQLHCNNLLGLDPPTLRVLLAVLPLQAFANVALAVAAEDDGAASAGRATWLHVFRAADLACCLGVLVPVVLTAARLRREAEAGDGKARRALDRLVAFRRFYVVFVTWVWATRVAALLLGEALPLTLSWVAPAVEEGATLLFYVYVGATFRPVAVGASYSHLTDEELAEIEL